MKRKIILSIIGILIIICTIFLSYEKINKENINNDNTGMFAIFLEEEKDSGKYQKSNLKTWPTEEEYTINMLKSYCENGSILRWNSVDKKISLKVNGTDKCYVYFDKAEIGTEKHPHLIQTIEDLVRLSNDVNGGKTYTGEYFLLTNDLDFNDPSDYEDANRLDFEDINGINGAEALIKELTTGSGFIPIGNSDINSFQGIFDGGNKRIDNLYINNNLNNYVGLFGYIVDAQINNLSISGNIKSSISMEAGVFSGWGKNFTITNCKSNVDIMGSTGNQSIGGFVGTAALGNNVIKNSQNYGNISNGNNTGGFIGNSVGTLLIDNSQNYGKITNDLGNHAGGLIGRDNGNYSQTTIINSHNEGLVKSINYAGGLISKINGKTVINKSYNNAAEIVGVISGGLIGDAGNSVDIQNSYNMADIKFSNEDKLSYAGGIIGSLNTTEQNTLTNVYNAGEISGTFRVGGLIGLLEADTIIDKSYNLGNIIGYNTTANTYFYLGGLVSHIYHATNSYKLIILNSYNLGNLKHGENVTINGDMGGLVLANSAPCETKIINSFNAGDVTSKNHNAMGIIWMDSNTTLNNVVNIGKIKGTSSYGIGRITNIETVTIENTYYENSVSASNINDEIGTSMALEQMNKQEFVDELNQNIASISLSEIDESLKDYRLSKWELGDNGYPTLINE